MWSTSLSTDTSGIHLQTQKCMHNTSWEQTAVPDQWKRIYRTMQNWASIGSWTIERLAHQTPDPLDYRVGPHPGCPIKSLTVLIYRVGPQPGRGPSMCLTHRTTEKDPRQGSPLSAWMGSAMEKAKEAFWLPATRGLKKDSDRAITPVVEAVHVPAHLALPASPQAKQLCHLHAQLSLGQNCCCCC